MRFPRETRALIHKAGSNPVTIPWPAGAAQPEPGKLYWMQSIEDVEKAEARRELSPETCAETLDAMYERTYGKPRKRKKKRRRRSALRPKAGDPRIRVLEVEIQEVGWEATVELYENPDPVRHSGLKTKVKGGEVPSAVFLGENFEPKVVATETEPEQLTPHQSRQRRMELEEALKTEHEASVDKAKLIAAERRVADLRSKGKRSTLAEAAAERARKRYELASAEVAA